MNAYKCDICGKYFEDAKALTGSPYSTYAEAIGHHRMIITLDDHSKDGRNLFDGDICPDCMGYFSVGLCERGCQDKKIKMYAANYIKKVQIERSIDKEAAENGTTE